MGMHNPKRLQSGDAPSCSGASGRAKQLTTQASITIPPNTRKQSGAWCALTVAAHSCPPSRGPTKAASVS
eukprot:1575218-Prymnesium_polylepis.1